MHQVMLQVCSCYLLAFIAFILLSCSAYEENHLIPLLWSRFWGWHYTDFSVFLFLSDAGLHSQCFWCLGFVKSLLTRRFPAEAVLQGWSYSVCLLAGLFWDSWPLPITPSKTVADQQFLRSGRAATSCPMLGKCVPGRLKPHFCFFLVTSIGFKITANPRWVCSLPCLVSMQQMLG